MDLQHSNPPRAPFWVGGLAALAIGLFYMRMQDYPTVALDARVRTLAMRAYEKGDYEQAVNLFAGLIERHPNNYSFLLYTAKSLHRLDKNDMALQVLSKVNEADIYKREREELYEFRETIQNRIRVLRGK